MNTKQRSTLERFQRIVTFFERDPNVLANAPAGYAKQLQALKSALARIEQGAADRGSETAEKAIEQQRALRQALRVWQLRPLRTLARVMARTVTGMPHLVPVPKALASTQRLLDVAKAVARDVSPYEAEFIDKGMSSDFLNQLQQYIQAVERAHTAILAARQRWAHARGELRGALRDARDAVVCLDLIVQRMCAADPVHGSGTLAAWNKIIPPTTRAGRLPSAEKV